MTAMPYGLGADALTIEVEPCMEEHRRSSASFGRETPHIVVKITNERWRHPRPILDAMLDRSQARAIGLALLNAAEALED